MQYSEAESYVAYAKWLKEKDINLQKTIGNFDYNIISDCWGNNLIRKGSISKHQGWWLIFQQ
jgi:hypothetical protein